MTESTEERLVRDMLAKQTPRPTLFFDVNIVEHCNLNCAHCGSFAPLAEEEYLDIDQYRKDMERLSYLTDGEMHHIQILGGEPLLNPNICEYLRIARKNFPIGIIRIVTNGLLVNKMDEEFWNVCRENHIDIAATEYPIKLDYAELRKYVESKGVTYTEYGLAVPWLKLGLTEKGDRNENHSFLKCQNANNCCTVRNGKVYACARIDKIRHLNKYFDKKFMVSKKDYLDIYEVNSLEEIMEFLAKPSPFCKYCNPFNTKEVLWKQSCKEECEWL